MTRRSLALSVLLLGGVACGNDELEPGDFPPGRVVLEGDAGNGSSSGGGGSSGTPEPEPTRYVITDESVEAAGLTQEYRVVVPRNRTSAKLPIVLAYHGDGGTGAQLQEFWKIEEAAGDSAIVVYPNRPGGWNVTDQSANNPYLAGFDAIVAKVVEYNGGDATDVSALGWSNGGFMTQIVACWRPGKLHAVGAMAGSYPYDSTSTGSAWPNSFPRCEGQGPVPALIMHGDSDGVGNGELSAKYWAYVNKCSAAPAGCNSDDTLRSPGLRPPCVKLDDAPASAPVHLCVIPNFGHEIWEHSAAAMWEFTRALP